MLNFYASDLSSDNKTSIKYRKLILKRNKKGLDKKSDLDTDEALKCSQMKSMLSCKKGKKIA